MGVPFTCFPTDRSDTVLRVLKVLRFVECRNCYLLLVIWPRCTANSQLQTKMFHVKHEYRLKRVLKVLRVLRFPTSMNTASGYKLDKILRLLRFLTCASSG